MSEISTVIAANPLYPEQLSENIDIVRCGQLYGSSFALLLAVLATRQQGLLLAVVPDSQTALSLQAELDFFLRGNGLSTLVFPDWETLPYDVLSPHQDIVSQRLATLYRLPAQRQGILIVPVATLLQRLAPRT